MNRKVKVLGKSFYSPSLKEVAGLGSIQLHFNFPYIFRIMYLMGGLDRVSVNTSIEISVDVLIDTRSIHGRYVDRVSVEYLPTLGRHTTDIPPNCHLSVDR